jgi:hypothetical protein
MSIKVKPPAGPAPLLKNAASAPFVYFDNVPVYGCFSGHLELELCARLLMPKPDGTVTTDLGCTAHLRCSPSAAAQLVDALTKALDMMSKQQERPSETLNSLFLSFVSATIRRAVIPGSTELQNPAAGVLHTARGIFRLPNSNLRQASSIRRNARSQSRRVARKPNLASAKRAAVIATKRDQ